MVEPLVAAEILSFESLGISLNFANVTGSLLSSLTGESSSCHENEERDRVLLRNKGELLSPASVLIKVDGSHLSVSLSLYSTISSRTFSLQGKD
jgi:hypothetical protein